MPGRRSARGHVAAPARRSAGLNPHDPLDVVYQGYTVLVCRHDGSIEGAGREGLWDFDTRILSRHRILLSGQRARHIGSGTPEADRWIAHLRVPRPGGTAAGPGLPQDSLELVVARRVGRGMQERLSLHNHSMTPAETDLRLEIDADFADVQEAGGPRLQHGRVERRWEAEAAVLCLDYHVEHEGRELRRGLRLRVVRSDSPPSYEEGGIRFTVALPPRGRWEATLSYESFVDGVWRTPLPTSPRSGTARDRLRRRWRARRAALTASHPVAEGAFEQAAEDLHALRNWEYDVAPDAWFPMAGVPAYTGVFGRDSLTAAWQGALIGPEMLRGAVEVIAATQATSDSAFHDREPGKLIHEMRRGPLSELGIIPQRAYYGTQTTPAMFVLALSELWHWTGADAVLRRHLDTALRTFDWAERYGDLDGDGFLEYVRRSPRGLKNHAWKDSDEAIRYPDGTLVEDPIATVEEQAYHYIALLRMAEILVALGDDERAAAFLRRARRLRRQWDEAFWVEEDGFYAMALDPEKRPVRSIGSNPGHALAAGLVPRRRARAVADRLMAPDLFNGWGIRTLSTEHPSYNPLAYHLGTVWPVENATFALGFKRYGLDGHVERLVSGLFAAAEQFHRFRLPEALGGHGADESPIPTVYPGANSPQAWSASAVIQLVQILLGIYPFAPARTLFLVRPRLPEWLEEVTLHGLRVGRARLSLRFRREKDGHAKHQVLEREGRVVILEPPPPDAVEGVGWIGRVERWLLAHAPGRIARAARIALGDVEAL